MIRELALDLCFGIEGLAVLVYESSVGLLLLLCDLAQWCTTIMQESIEGWKIIFADPRTIKFLNAVGYSFCVGLLIVGAVIAAVVFIVYAILWLIGILLLAIVPAFVTTCTCVCVCAGGVCVCACACK